MKIIYLPEKMAQAYSYKLDEKTIIISITCPGEDDVIFDNNIYLLDIFRMKFNDLDTDVDNVLVAPAQKDFIGLKDFIDTYKDVVTQIIVHCGAGASRSPGCALAICDYLNDNELRQKCEKENYNKKVYSLAKNELCIGKDANFYDNLFNN